MHFLTNGATLLFLLFACAFCGVLWFLVDHHIITPIRLRKAERAFRAELRKMRHVAGAHAHLPRRVRRHRARVFAKKMSILARVTGQTAGMPRHHIKRSQKALAWHIAHGAV